MNARLVLLIQSAVLMAATYALYELKLAPLLILGLGILAFISLGMSLVTLFISLKDKRVNSLKDYIKLQGCVLFEIMLQGF